MSYEEIKNQAAQAVTELLKVAKLSEGDISLSDAHQAKSKVST